MLTEQEVLAHINDKIAKNQLKETSNKYVEKLKVLQEILQSHQKNIEDYKQKLTTEETQSMRTRGAISILLEMLAEEEGLLVPNQNPAKS